MTIGERIKIRREELHLSQDELAKRLGYKSRSSINKIETGSRELTQTKIKAIADALDTTPSYIMGWTEEWDKKFDTEKLSAEAAMWEFIDEQYGKTTTEIIHSVLELNPKDRDKIGKLLEGYSKLDEEDRIILFGRIYQILEDMLSAEKYSKQKELSNGKAM